MVLQQGYAIDREESIIGVTGVAIVVSNRSGEPVIGLSIAGLSSQFTDEGLRSLFVP